MDSSTPGCASWPAYARRVIEAAVRGRDPAHAAKPPDDPRPHAGVFVTLHKLNHLRGCIGTLDASLPLADAVRQAATNAALQDPRFAPVEPAELPHLHIEVSILSPPTPMRTLDDLELGRHGVIVQRGPRRGLFLPQVAQMHRLSKEEFVTRCCAEKANLPPDAWRDPETEVLLFTAEILAE